LDGAGVPVLVVQGDRDPFGLPPPGKRREVVVIPGGDHSLRRDPATVASAVLDAVTAMIGRGKVNR
jgi:pimeloyl-ACP methyl ester carboxylesterase